MGNREKTGYPPLFEGRKTKNHDYLLQNQYTGLTQPNFSKESLNNTSC